MNKAHVHLNYLLASFFEGKDISIDDIKNTLTSYMKGKGVDFDWDKYPDYNTRTVSKSDAYKYINSAMYWLAETPTVENAMCIPCNLYDYISGN